MRPTPGIQPAARSFRGRLRRSLGKLRTAAGSMSMTVALVLLGVAALGGATLFALRLRGGNPPLILAGLHGLLAASALVSVIVVAARGGQGMAWLPAVVLTGAAVVGFTLFANHVKGRLIPIGPVFLHVLLAFLGIVLYVAWYVSSRASA